MIFWIDAQLPPQLTTWLTQHRLQQVFAATFEQATSLLREGSAVVDIGDAS